MKKTGSKAGVVAALNHRGFHAENGPFPEVLKAIAPAATFTNEELEWADYLIADPDFGGAWNDAAQIEMHLS